MDKLTQDYNEDIQGWTKERHDLQRRLQEMASQMERAKEEWSNERKSLKAKLQEYKDKVRKANASINVLA